jgi:hypothetical protein
VLPALEAYLLSDTRGYGQKHIARPSQGHVVCGISVVCGSRHGNSSRLAGHRRARGRAAAECWVIAASSTRPPAVRSTGHWPHVHTVSTLDPVIASKD